MYRDIFGFTVTSYMQRIMNINGCYASIMRAEKKEKDTGSELPLGIPIPVLPLDYLKEYPEHWIGGEGSYVCPIDSEWALWFNWSMNNTTEMAILSTVKGMNPLTGQRLNSYNLEHFTEKCPIHDIPFKTGKLCSECGFKWPEQNYITYPNQYLDGFVTPNGNVRQFYFTEEMAKSIPEKVIGRDDTVPAFGFCFYHLKNRKKNYEGGVSFRDEFPESLQNFSNFKDLSSIDLNFYSDTSSRYRSCSTSCSTVESHFRNDSSGSSVIMPEKLTNGMLDRKKINRGFSKALAGGPISPPFRDRSNIEVGLGAGEKIKQIFNKSKYSTDDWEKKPTGVIRLYFVFQEEFEKYVSAGFNDLNGSKEGYLEGLPVGG